ncbi:Ethanolamine ammonia-lyase heavy chain [Aliiruegeria lutimaris]|uniref:Ethanolamine ammonia-lyase heavy chain n=1 Tax=Aliiruegeria lutimaris TaxID=571298 RepID=A0A1G8S195_9RHOB|nr:ethanolamine ammonia-lyase subunit EutB [Aliiruegeria lutimaris]SDJ22565.1 Ethanolamine ammonia-lyase heavy chain [Aliiruegeria lutimaris]
MAAVVSKIMRNRDLTAVAHKVEVIAAFRTTLGLPGRLGSRLQPNHPADHLAGTAASTLDGLTLGVGDAVIGVNLAPDNIDTATRSRRKPAC